MNDQAEGVLLLDKPSGITSFGVVERVRRWSRIKKVGHTGTLDPFATGLLVLCLGMATRLADYITNWDKEYEGAIRLGVETDTDDATGSVLAQRDCSAIEPAQVEEVLKGFLGEIEQMPPVFSAKKLSGVPSYKRARKGESVDLRPVRVRIHELEFLGMDRPLVFFRARCSKGTYMRSLARDVGAALGCGAHLASLRRTAVGDLRVEDAIPWEELKRLRAQDLRATLWPAERVLAGWKRFYLPIPLVRRLCHGQDIPLEALSEKDSGDHVAGQRVVLASEVGGGMFGVGVIVGEGTSMRIHPEKIWRSYTIHQ